MSDVFRDGFIRYDRALFTEVRNELGPCAWAVFVELVANAAYQLEEVTLPDGTKRILKPGQTLFSGRRFGERLGMSKGKAYAALKDLEATGWIEVESGHKAKSGRRNLPSIVTITFYGRYFCSPSMFPASQGRSLWTIEED